MKNPEELLTLLNTSFATKYNYEFSYDDNEQRFFLKNNGDYSLQLSSSLATILGFSSLKNEVVNGKSSFRADEFPVLDRAITSLYVYSNIVQNVFIGNVKASLLLTCPFHKKTSDSVVQLEFLNPTYTKLNRSTLHQIDIAIHDEAGAIVPFLYGKTVLNLTFRKCQNY